MTVVFSQEKTDGWLRHDVRLTFVAGSCSNMGSWPDWAYVTEASTRAAVSPASMAMVFWRVLGSWVVQPLHLRGIHRRFKYSVLSMTSREATG